MGRVVAHVGQKKSQISEICRDPVSQSHLHDDGPETLKPWNISAEYASRGVPRRPASEGTLEPARHRLVDCSVCTLRLASISKQVREWGKRHNVRCLGRQFRIDGYECVGLELRHREVLGLVKCVPVVFPGDLPRGAPRDPVAE